MPNQPELSLPLFYPINSFILVQAFQQYSISIEKESFYLSQLINLATDSLEIKEQLREWVSNSSLSSFSITGLLNN